MLEAAAEALLIISDPNRLMFVALGTLLGLMIGVIPGIGGLVGLALLLPFTFALDPYTIAAPAAIMVRAVFNKFILLLLFCRAIRNP